MKDVADEDPFGWRAGCERDRHHPAAWRAAGTLKPLQFPTMSAPTPSAPTHGPMDQFTVLDGELAVGGMPLSRLAARVGSTPFYAYDRALLSARVAQLRAALPAAV